MRSWIVGRNEIFILGEGWYGRRTEWFGLPFRESFAEAELRIPNLRKDDRLFLMVGSALAFHEGSQEGEIAYGDHRWEFNLKRLPQGRGWDRLRIEIPDPFETANPGILRIETEPWRHADYEPVEDYREVGILLGAVFVDRPLPG